MLPRERWPARAWLLTMLVTACSGSVRSHPESMSADEHRKVADAEEREAREEAARGSTSSVGIGLPVVPNINADSQDLGRIENAGAASLDVGPSPSDRAATLRRHAQEHRRAAAELEAFTDAACDGVGASARKTSPLHRRVARVTTIDKGVRLLLKPNVDADELLAAARCHQAFARERGYEGGHVCPLYVPDIQVVLEPGGKALRVTSAKPGYAKVIRSRARHLVGPGERK